MLASNLHNCLSKRFFTSTYVSSIKNLLISDIFLQFFFKLITLLLAKNTMQNFIKLQNVLIDPKRTFDDFKTQLFKSQITQFTYLCLLLNIAATIKRPNFNFQQYLELLINFKNQPGYRSSCINYTGYKDKISILMNACEKSVSSTVYILAHHPDIKIHAVDPHGLNAVFYAIRNPDQTEGLKILEILKDISPQIMDTVINNGYSPLFLAVQKFRIRIVDFLLRNDIDPNQKLISNGNTAMHQLVKISSRYNLQQVKKMIETFLKHGFNLSIKNSLQRTVQQYAYDLRFNLTQIINQIKTSKNQFKYNLSEFSFKSQFGFKSEQSQTQAYSSKQTHIRIGDICTTNYNYSQRQESELNEMEGLSISDNKSLFSEAIYKQRYFDERDKEFSVDMNVNQSQNDQLEDLADSQLEEIDRKIQCHSHSDSPKSQFQQDQQLNSNQSKNQQKNLRCAKFQQSLDSQSQGSSSSQTSNGQVLKIENINYQKIENDILEFDQISQQIYISAWKQIQPFFIKLNQITQSFGLLIQIVGSFATGLWTHLSDIDIALIAVNENFIDFQRLLDKLYGKLKVRMYNMGIKQLSYNKVSKIPSIKIQMDPYLFSSRKIDIMIFHKKNIAITYVNFIRQSLTTYPYIRPLYFFLKRICQQFGLHDPFNGGMKSYSIFLMIFSMIKTLQLTNLGQIILKICLYYGFYHEYDYEIQHYKSLQQYQTYQQIPVLRLNIKDPLNIKNNMGGKNTNAYKVKNMFRTIYYGLHKKIQNGTHLQYILELAKITNQ